MAILCASTSLMIRTYAYSRTILRASLNDNNSNFRIAIWERKLTVVIPLLILCLAHWGVLYHGIIIVRATWDAETGSCSVNQTNSAILKFTFFTSTFLLFPSTAMTIWSAMSFFSSSYGIRSDYLRPHVHRASQKFYEIWTLALTIPRWSDLLGRDVLNKLSSSG